MDQLRPATRAEVLWTAREGERYLVVLDRGEFRLFDTEAEQQDFVHQIETGEIMRGSPIARTPRQDKWEQNQREYPDIYRDRFPDYGRV